MEAFKKLYPEEFFEKFLNEGIRPDGRKLDEKRDVFLSVGSINTAYGSSMVKIGNTSIVTGINAQLGPIDSKVDSQIIINVEVGPLSSANIRPGRPSKTQQVLSSKLYNIIEQTNYINTDNLTVETEEGILYWYIVITLYCLNNDGNLFDACLLGLISALQNVKIPEVKIIKKQYGSGKVVEEKDVIVKQKNKFKKLQLNSDFPCSLSFILINDYLLTDPTYEEEQLQDGVITVIVGSESKKIYDISLICDSIKQDIIKDCISNSINNVDEIISIISNNDNDVVE
eukprot:TRINITY_DN6144_c0_g1_i1.p1 TRINITY_DN6144_c0_g1~~TRINITY_DN6144_c0_g1_i1.p1  ORF type:complete len:285 (+),score=75.49 TRINITY_DN6144_c0_g1_i1:71-925(+)